MICERVYPLGENCILKTDMYHQYAPFFSELREKLQTGGSLSFTWNLGLGVNFIAIMAYYLASPFNWLIILVGENYTIEFMSVLIVLRAGLSGMAMAAYLRYKAPNIYFGAVLFSIFYALSGFYCAYYWNIMWLDTIAIFPIIMLGAEKIIKGESGVIYAAALGYSIFANYYISIMICIFLVLYFFMYCIMEGFDSVTDFIKVCFRFAFWSLIAGGVSAVFLLPEIYALGATASSKSTFPKTFQQYFTIIDMLARHMAGVETEQWNQHFPNIYCGTAAYLLICLYYMCSKISIKEKTIYTISLLILLAGFSINVFNYIWHGLRFPNSLPARQSFIYCFLVIFMCFRVYEYRDSITKKEIGTAFAVSVGFILLAQHLLTENDQFHFAVFYGALILTAIYAGLFHAYRKGIFTPQRTAIVLLIIAVIEVSANAALTSFTTTSRTAYLKDNNEIRTLIDRTAETDADFYRFERINRKTKDDGAWLNFHAVSLFSSMANAGCTSFFSKLGCEGSTNAYSITGSTPLADMFFGVKYAFYEGEQTDAQGIELADREGEVWLYRNSYALPLGFALPSRVNDGWVMEFDDPVLIQNTLCDVLGVSQILVPVQGGKEENGKYTVTLSEDGEYYAFAAGIKAGSKSNSVTVNWPEKKKTFEHLDRRYLMELGECKRGQLLRINSDDAGKMDLRLYRFDYSVLGDIYDKMSRYPLTITAYGDDFIKGEITVEPSELGYYANKAMVILTTPYDEGWKVKVDGEPVTIYKGLDTFVGLYVEEGTHTLEMHYEPKGLKTGMIISLISVLILIGAAVLERRRKPDKKEIIENTDNEETDNDIIRAVEN